MQKSPAKLRLATVNVGTLVGKNAELTKTVGKMKVDVDTLQEVRSRNEGVKTLRAVIH